MSKIRDDDNDDEVESRSARSGKASSPGLYDKNLLEVTVKDFAAAAEGKRNKKKRKTEKKDENEDESVDAIMGVNFEKSVTGFIDPEAYLIGDFFVPVDQIQSVDFTLLSFPVKFV
jgi:hypothetical protein